MSYDPAKHHRRSIRLKGYDYSQAGAYFVTICINQRLTLLGEISDGEMLPNEPGRMVQSVWDAMPSYYPGVELDAFTLMPNHVHGIIVLTNSKATIETIGKGATTGGLPLQVMMLGDIVHRFKSLTTAKYRYGVQQLSWKPFPGKLWQRNYYEHIIRNQESLQIIRQYVANNPLTWQLDQLHPHNPSKW